MQDEHFIRDWNASHIRFSRNFDRALLKVARRLHGRLGSLLSIGKAYEWNEESRLARKARLTGNAVFGGLASGMTLALIFVTLTAIVSPEPSHALTSMCVAPHFLA